MSTRVLIADDQGLVRVGLRKVLDVEHDLTVAGEAYDGRMAVDLSGMLAPDIVLMDTRMPVLDGVAATREISEAHPGVRVLALSTYGADGYVFDALRAGASGFLPKDAPPADLVSAVRLVARGEAMLAPAVTRSVIEEFAQTPTNPRIHPPEALRHLTSRERDVFDLLARGRSNAEICRALRIGEATTKTHVTRILAKLDLRDRVQVVIYAYESGLMS